MDDEEKGREKSLEIRKENRRRKERRGTIAMKCIREMKERWKRGKIIGKWEQERKEFFRGREVGKEEEEEDEVEYDEIEKRDNRKQRSDRNRNIKESRYNEWYKKITIEGIPKYLEKGWTEKRWNRVLKNG